MRALARLDPQAVYLRELASLTRQGQRMLEAGRSGDWERALRLSHERDEAVRSLFVQPIPATLAQLASATLQTMLEQDRELAAVALAAQATLRAELLRAKTASRARQAYRSVG